MSVKLDLHSVNAYRKSPEVVGVPRRALVLSAAFRAQLEVLPSGASCVARARRGARR